MSFSLEAVFGVDTTGAKASLQDFVDSNSKSATDIANRVGEKLYGLREVGTTIATALGLNLEKIAENLARSLTDMSKEEEEAYKSTTDLTAKIADLNKKTAAAKNTDAQNYQIALNDERRALDALNDAKNVQARLDAIAADENLSNWDSEKKQDAEKITSIAKIKQAELDYTQAIANADTLKAKMTKEQGDLQAKNDLADQTATDKATDAAIKLLDLDTQHQRVAGEISILESEIAIKRAAGLATAAEDTRLATVRTQLGEIEKTQGERKAADAATLLKLDQDAEKAAYDRLTPEEQLADLMGKREDLAYNLAHDGENQIQRQQDFNDLQALDLEIAKKRAIAEAQLNQELAAGKKLLAERIPTVKEERDAFVQSLQEQIQKNDEIIAKEVERTGTEDDVTIALRGQNTALKEQIADIDAAHSAWDGYHVAVTGGADFAAMSTASLQGMVDKLQKELTAPGSHGQQIGNSDINREYGDYLTASNIRGQLNPAQQELALRNEVVAYDKIHGDAATTAMYGDSITQRALQGYLTAAQQTNTVLQALLDAVNKI